MIDEGCNYDLDGTSLTWTDPPFPFPGPVTVVFGDDDLGGDDSSTGKCEDDPGKVDMEVRVHYPGRDGMVASGGPFPLVIILHGNQLPSIPGYEGYDYLGELLASHGFIVASIDGRSLLNATIKSRGEHVREWLRRFVRLNAMSGSFLEGQLDLSKVALVGHSRGGEAVVAAAEWQRVSPDPGYTIAAISAIAPVQFIGQIPVEPDFKIHLRDVAYQILQGSHDCDVCEFPGNRQYDWAADILAVGETLKSLVFIKDANHNFFNTVWEELLGNGCKSWEYLIGSKSDDVLSGQVARDLAKAYIHAFLEVVIKGDGAFRGYLTGEVPNPVAGTTFALDFQAPGSGFIPLDHFEELYGYPHDEKLNSQGGKVKASAMAYEEERFAKDEAAPRDTYKGETFGAYLLWKHKLARFSSSFPKGAPFNPRTPDHLSFRAGQIFRSSGSLNPPGVNQNFRVLLQDAGGNKSAKVLVSDFAPIHPPFPSVWLNGIPTFRTQVAEDGTRVEAYFLESLNTLEEAAARLGRWELLYQPHQGGPEVYRVSPTGDPAAAGTPPVITRLSPAERERVETLRQRFGIR